MMAAADEMLMEGIKVEEITVMGKAKRLRWGFLYVYWNE